MCSHFWLYSPPCPGNVQIANAAVTQAAGEGSDSVLSEFSLFNVLLSPQFSFNLVSVSALTKIHNHSTKLG